MIRRLRPSLSNPSRAQSNSSVRRWAQLACHRVECRCRRSVRLPGLQRDAPELRHRSQLQFPSRESQLVLDSLKYFAIARVRLTEGAVQIDDVKHLGAFVLETQSDLDWIGVVDFGSI